MTQMTGDGAEALGRPAPDLTWRGPAGSAPRTLLGVDIGWRNLVFSVRTALAAILALAIAYWLELTDPQWATLTVYLLAQPTVGAAVGKSVWRTVGTVAGGLVGLGLVLVSQAPELLVTGTVLAVAISFYAGARLRNYASYAALLAGYTVMLVAFEGATDPLNAWSIAVDRTSEILIGIACSTLATTLVLPRYAGDSLREGLARTFSNLVGYVATALELATPPAVFAQLRQRMVADVASFDALCSYAMFEAPDMRADERGLRRSVRECLLVLSIARGLVVRVDGFEHDGARLLREHLRPTLQAIAERLRRLAPDPATWQDPHRLRREILAARVELEKAAADLERSVGAVPFDVLANGMLVLRRAGSALHGLAMVVVAEGASLRRRRPSAHGRPLPPGDGDDRGEALLLGLRAGLAVLVLSVIWLATAWSEGFAMVSGGAVMLFFAVRQDAPLAGAKTYLVWSCIGIAVSYLTMVFVIPLLQGFGELAIVLLLLLLPAGLMAGTPKSTWAGIALGGYIIAQIGTANLFVPDERSLVNGAGALLLGMLVCLAVIAAVPVNSYAKRGQSWQRTLGAILPAVARGERAPRAGADAIIATLSGLLPRLDISRARDDHFFRGTLSMASVAVELGRLGRIASDPAVPLDIAAPIRRFLDQFASTLEQLATPQADRARVLDAAAAALDDLRAALTARATARAGAARPLLEAGASLRFIADRLYIDRAYLERSFAED